MLYRITLLLYLLVVSKAEAQNTLDKAGLGAGVNASAAYSIRLLSSSYSGKAIQVRRSSDNSTQDIGFTSSGDLDTVALKTFVGSGSGYVSRWYDQSGNSKNLTQTSTGNQPILVTSGTINRENTRPFLQFWGFPHVGYNSLVLPAAMTTTGHVSSVMKFASGGYGFILSHSSVYYWHSYPGSYLINSDPALPSSSVRNGNGWTNGIQASQPSSIPWPTSLAVQQLEPATPNSGTDWDNIGMDRGSCCHVISGGGGYSELIVFSTALSSSNRSALANNEKTYFGIVTLALNFMSFTASIEDAKAYLQWESARQEDGMTFQVQHSADGQTWTTIATLPATVNRYVHDAPRPGINYYRIATTSPDGSSTFSPVSQARLIAPITDEYKLLRNPVSDRRLSIRVMAATILSIHTMDGKLLWKKRCSVGTQEISLYGYPPGIYLLRSTARTVRFVVE